MPADAGMWWPRHLATNSLCGQREGGILSFFSRKVYVCVTSGGKQKHTKAMTTGQGTGRSIQTNGSFFMLKILVVLATRCSSHMLNVLKAIWSDGPPLPMPKRLEPAIASAAHFHWGLAVPGAPDSQDAQCTSISLQASCPNN